MARKNTNPHIGSSFDAFLVEQGILEDCEYQALKEMLADPEGGDGKEWPVENSDGGADGDQPPAARPLA